MSVVAKYVAPITLGVPAVLTLLKTMNGSATFMKGATLLGVSVALQIMMIRRCALGGRPSNKQGVFAMFYIPLVLLPMVLSAILLQITSHESRLGVSSNNPVYQYRLSDVIDRVRAVVGERTAEDDVIER